MFIFVLQCLLTIPFFCLGEIIVMDNDAGPDDALAIYLTLTSNVGKSVKAITTVRGNTDVNFVVQNDLKTLGTANYQVPIYNGSQEPVSGSIQLDYYFGRDGFGDFEYHGNTNESLVQEQSAVDFIIELVQQNPGQVTIICTGPLTNIAKAGLKYPQLFDQAKLLILGGSVNGTGNMGSGVEFNMYADPIAAKYVFESIPESNPVTLVPYESFSGENAFPKEFRTERISQIDNRITRLLDSAERLTIPVEADWSPADPMAATLHFYPEVIQSTTYGKPVVDEKGQMTITDGNTAEIVLSFHNDLMGEIFVQYLSACDC